MAGSTATRRSSSWRPAPTGRMEREVARSSAAQGFDRATPKAPQLLEHAIDSIFFRKLVGAMDRFFLSRVPDHPRPRRIGVMNIMLVSVCERTPRDRAAQWPSGATPRRHRAQFFLEGLTLTLVSARSAAGRPWSVRAREPAAHARPVPGMIVTGRTAVPRCWHLWTTVGVLAATTPAGARGADAVEALRYEA